jgi:DNA-binding CsgD family transcriptional regulator
VLTAIADLTNSQGGILFGQSFTAQRIYFDFNGRLDEECNRAYQERHMQNPWSQYMEHQPIGRLVLSDEAIALSDLRKTGFYHDVLRPQSITHNGMMALASRRDFRAAFNLCRGERQGQFAPDEQRLLEWLSPHMCRSVALGFRIDGYLAMQQAAYNILEHLADGVIVTDRQAPGGTMSLPRNAEGHLLTILVTSLRGKDIGRLSDAGYKDAAALLFVIDPANRRSIPLSQIMDAYGLTQAEARVALAASSGNTVAETAQLLNLSPNTIKTHLRRVFAKTATGRQAELAGLIAAIGSVRLLGQEGE